MLPLLPALLLLALHPLGAPGETAPAPSPRTYTVRKSDTLSGIAKAHEVTVKDLLTFNELSNPDRLTVGQVLRIPPASGLAALYIVEKGDSLARIAKDHGLAVADLVEANKLMKPDEIVVGQEILIPRAAAKATTAQRLDPAIRKRLDAIRPKPGRWRYIVVHHSATKQGSAKGMDSYHRDKRHMVNGLAYHFVIGNGRGMGLGEIEIGNRWKQQLRGGHLASESLNRNSIGICLVGNFEQGPPPKEQMDALVRLTQYLQAQCGIPDARVKTHTQINTRPTKCPGKHFPTKAFLSRL